MPIALGERAHRRARQSHEIPTHILNDWRLYRRTGGVKARNRLIAHYMRTHVRPIASRVHFGLPKQVDVDDLVQQGYLGLIDAMDRFKIDHGVRFETFSRPRIFGAIQDYLRAIDPVPRLTRTRTKKLQAAHETFCKQHGREPSDDELRPMLDMNDKAFRRTITERRPAAVIAFSSVQGDANGGEDEDPMAGFADMNQAGPFTTVEKRDLQHWVTRGLDRRDRLIITLYYYEHMTMREIGDVLGISESRVSQRRDSIIGCLRSRMLATGAEQEFVFESCHR